MDTVELRPELVTTFPMYVGVDVLAEVGPRLRGSVGVGVLPGPYVDGVVAGIRLLYPEFTDENAALVESSLRTSLVLPVHAGWRPIPKLGATFGVGYTLVALGGGATGSELLEGIAGIQLPDEEGRRFDEPLLEFQAASTLHLVGAEIGWDQRLWRSLHLRAGLGWSFTVAARTNIEPAFEPGPVAEAAVDALEVEGEAFLDDIYTSYAHPPNVTVAVGWSF